MTAAVTFQDESLLDGRYEIVAQLGRGMFGEVLRARDRASPHARDVCIKRIAAPLAPEHARALREEARLLARVRHGNVVSLLALGEERRADAPIADARGAPYLVLELVDGMDLRALGQVLAALAPPDEAEPRALVAAPVAVHLACCLLRALAAVQRAAPGLVHRDVTPHNVLLSRDGEVKLADFGIALARDRARWTHPTLVKGKPGYMAPEQIRGEAIDPRADLFAVGVILCELLARKRPWRLSRLRGMDELRAIARGDIVSILALRPDLDRDLAAVVDRLLAIDPRARFSTAESALRALAPFSAGEVGALRIASILEVALRARASRASGHPADEGERRSM